MSISKLILKIIISEKDMAAANAGTKGGQKTRKK
jgi:hypothetical protein